MPFRSRSMFAAFVLVFAACSSKSPDAPTACADMMRAYCEQRAACAPYEMEVSFGGDIDACVASSSATCNAIVTVPGSGMTASYFEGCASAVREQSCDAQVLKSPEACSTPRGTLADGVACLDGSQCKGGECFGAAFTNGTEQCGTCTESPATTGCASSDQCPGDQVCVYAGDVTDAGVVSSWTGKCGDAGKAGAACGSPTSPPCAGDLYCQYPADGNMGTCVARPSTAGASCDPSQGPEGCAGGLACLGGTCVLPKYIPVGGSCPTPGEPIPSQAEVCAGGVCIEGTCVAYAIEGSPCTTNGYGASCRPDLQCLNGTCGSGTTATYACK